MAATCNQWARGPFSPPLDLLAPGALLHDPHHHLTSAGTTAPSTIMHITVVAALGALLGVLAAWVASFRTRSQPTGAHPDAEAALIGAVLASPAQFRRLVILEPDGFAWPPHQRLWATLYDLAVDDNDEAHVREAEEAGLPSLTLPFSSEELVERLDREGVLADVDPLALKRTPLRAEDLMKVGAKVLSGADDRADTGARPPRPGDTHRQPLVRDLAYPGPRRLGLTALAGAASLGLVAAAGTQGWLLVAAGLLCLSGLVAALVDIDTMYVDTVAVLGMAAAVAVAALTTEDTWSRLLLAGGTVVLIVGGLEVTAFIWSRIRHRVGLGGGDSLVLAPMVAVPVISTGLVESGLWGLLAALVATVTGQGIRIATGRTTAATKFPWVPYLMCGWPVGWYLAVQFGTF